MERDVSIDIAKGICIILVVIGHLLQFDCSGLAKNTLFNYIYAFHMPVFMMLSGYVASYGNFDVPFTKLILRRFRQLMVPFFVWMVLTVVYWHTSLAGDITALAKSAMCISLVFGRLCLGNICTRCKVLCGCIIFMFGIHGIGV